MKNLEALTKDVLNVVDKNKLHTIKYLNDNVL